MKMRRGGKRIEQGEEFLARERFEKNLPSKASCVMFIEGRSGGQDEKRLVVLNNFFIQDLNVFNGGGFGFVSYRKFE